MVPRALTLLACAAIGCAGAAPRASAPTTLEGLDVAGGLDPFPIACTAPLEGTAEEREQRARRRWDEGVMGAELGRHEQTLAAWVDAYCLMEDDPRQPDLLHPIAVLLQDLGRYRAAYETFRRAVAEGGDVFDGFMGWRSYFLRSILRSAAERLEAGDPPFALCGANDRPACARGEECARDYARFNDGFCPTLVQLDQSCPGVCVPERILREEESRAE
jgi:hypothetical protein